MKAILNLFRKRTITNHVLKLTIEHINQQRSTTYGTRDRDTTDRPTNQPIQITGGRNGNGNLNYGDTRLTTTKNCGDTRPTTTQTNEIRGERNVQN